MCEVDKKNLNENEWRKKSKQEEVHRIDSNTGCIRKKSRPNCYQRLSWVQRMISRFISVNACSAVNSKNFTGKVSSHNFDGSTQIDLNSIWDLKVVEGQTNIINAEDKIVTNGVTKHRKMSTGLWNFIAISLCWFICHNRTQKSKERKFPILGNFPWIFSSSRSEIYFRIFLYSIESF